MSGESGYATITITAVLFSLSIMAVAYLHFASSSAQASGRVAQQIQIDAALEGRLNQTLADLINGRTKFNGNLVETTAKNLERTVHISISDEAKRVNINRSSSADIEHVVKNVIENRSDRDSILKNIRAREGKSELVMAIDDLAPENVQPRTLHCLEEHLTVFQSANAIKTRHNSPSLAGRVLRISVETRDTDAQNRGLKSIVLFTGNAKDPAWVMDWQRYNAPQFKACRI